MGSGLHTFIRLTFLSLGACPTLPKMTDLGGKITVAESRSLILSQMRAPKFSCFLMSDRLLGGAA